MAFYLSVLLCGRLWHLIKNSNISFSVDSKLSSNSKPQDHILSNPQCSMKCYICGKLEPQFSVKLQHHVKDGKHISKETWLQLFFLAKISIWSYLNSKTTIHQLLLLLVSTKLSLRPTVGWGYLQMWHLLHEPLPVWAPGQPSPAEDVPAPDSEPQVAPAGILLPQIRCCSHIISILIKQCIPSR